MIISIDMVIQGVKILPPVIISKLCVYNKQFNMNFRTEQVE